MPHIKTLTHTAPWHKMIEILDQDGCLIIEGLPDMTDFGLLKLQIASSLDDIRSCNGNFFGHQTKRMNGIIARCPASRSLAVNDVIRRIMDHFLLKSCRRYQLNLTQAVQILPGEPAQNLHADDLMFPFSHPGNEAMINCQWALDDLTADNGAMLLVPGSHKWSEAQKRATGPAVHGAMRAGSVLVYFGSLLHGNGANVSPAPKTSLIVSYSLGWLKQAENSFLSVPQKLAKTLDPELQRLLGYFVHPPGDRDNLSGVQDTHDDSGQARAA